MKIEVGTQVTLHYTLVVDGRREATSRGSDPIRIIQGDGALVPGLEAALIGHEAGDHFTVEVAPEQGYGPRRYFGPERVDRARLPASAHVVPGMRMRSKQKDGTFVELWVTRVEPDAVWMDFEHPLVGKTLVFEVEVLSVGASPAVA